MSTSRDSVYDPSRLRIISMTAEDRPGVIARVSGMIRRRGFNIEGFSAGPLAERGASRMTLTVDAGHAESDQVAKQLDRLVEVLEIDDITDVPNVHRELVLVKLRVKGLRREQALEGAAGFGGHQVDAGPEHVIVEISGPRAEVEAGLEALKQYEIVDVARSGPVAMAKGD